MFLSTLYEQNTMRRASLLSLSDNKEFKTREDNRIDAGIPRKRYCVNFCVLIDFYQRTNTSSKPNKYSSSL